MSWLVVSLAGELARLRSSRELTAGHLDDLADDEAGVYGEKALKAAAEEEAER